MRKTLLYLSYILIVYSCSPSNKIITSATPESIAQAIDSSHWQFIPQQAIPIVGRTRQITSDFIVQYSKTQLTVYLPYFGRASAGANILSGKGPLDFTSKDFTAEVLHSKEGQWNITVKPKDYTEVQQMSFNLFSNGTASLDVILTNRSAIRFNGSVVATR